MTFEEIRALCPVYTLVDDNRQKLIYNLVQATKDLNGVMAEIGVYKGGTSFLISSVAPDKKLYSCDTFEGLPAPSVYDTHKKGDFSDTSFEAVYNLLKNKNIEVQKGLFPHDEVYGVMYWLTYSFVHIDVDLHDSTLDCLEFFYDRMTKGGIIVIDDYDMPSCPGVKEAVDSFMTWKPEKLIVNESHSCWFIKE